MVNAFLEHFGFTADPFESTNADQEPDLAEYFIAPPYFTSVLGDASSPQSHIVFAPRGGGKSAQRRMIEQDSERSTKYLCLTYDKFDQPPGFAAKDATWAYHMNQLCRLIVQAIVQLLEDDSLTALDLSKQRKQLLQTQIDYFLGSLTAEQFQNATTSLKTFPQRSAEFLKRYSGPIGVALEVVKKRWGMDFEIPTSGGVIDKQDASLKFHFAELLKTVQELGYDSCYILVDKIDELSITGTSKATFEMIAPLISDLPTLETPGVAFKFFLWDQLEATYDDSGYARRDRIPVYKLDWSVQELERMVSERIRVYSRGAVSSVNQLLSEPTLDVHRLLAILANGSPRDMIRMAKRITSDALRISDDSKSIAMDSVWAGIAVFCEERARELYGSYLADLKKVGKPTFTTSFLGSDIFRVSENAARRKIQLWTEKGLVAKVDELPNPPNRPLYLYGVTDIRACLAAFSDGDPELILGNYAYICSQCGRVVISDRQSFRCAACNAQMDSGASSVWAACLK